MGRVPKELTDCKIFLLDSCSYLRLAKDIQPLLNIKHNHPTVGDFGLLVHDGLINEYNVNPRLKNKFPWVKEKEFATEVKLIIKLTPAEKKRVADVISFVRDYAFANQGALKGVGEADIQCVSVAQILEITLVTEDHSVSEICKEFDIAHCSCIKVLGLLWECGHIDIDRVRAIIEYWKYNKDLPGKESTVRKEFYDLFKENL